MIATGKWAVRARTISDIAALVARQPSRLSEVGRWLVDRNQTTLESRTPWWPYPAIRGVAMTLPPNADVFEYGAGGSTLWLHDLGARVTSVEHDSTWFNELRDALPDDVELVLREPSKIGSVPSESEPQHFFDDYVAELAARPDDAYDLVIVDGRARVECGLVARTKVKPRGMLLLDDSDRPRYRPLLNALASWERTDYRGLKIGGGGTVQTSVWRRRG